jgi:hypothetical protein
MLLDNFAFRTATEFIDVPAKVALNIQVAPKNSTSAANAIYTLNTTLDSAKTYIAVANGIVSSTGYSPMKAFALDVYNMGREMANSMSNTDILVVHGATDAPTVDVRAGSSVLVDNLEYGNFSNYLSLPANNYVITLTDMSGSTEIAKYQAPLQSLNLGGAAITVLASGFVNRATNSNGPGFGLYAASAAGGALVQLPVATNINDKSKNAVVNIYPNPAQDNILISSNKPTANVQLSVYDLAGKEVLSTTYTNSTSLNISSLQKGMYVVKSTCEGETTYQKFVKQ